MTFREEHEVSNMFDSALELREEQTPNLLGSPCISDRLVSSEEGESSLILDEPPRQKSSTPSCVPVL